MITTECVPAFGYFSFPTKLVTTIKYRNCIPPYSTLPPIIIDTPLIKIVKHGTFYFPASNHYISDVNVVCNVCKTKNISACVGYDRYDLCLSCVKKVTDNYDIKNDVSNKKNNFTKLTPTAEEVVYNFSKHPHSATDEGHTDNGYIIKN